MQQAFRRSGPIGTSCLTCKRRRKKCDKTRPACDRCTDGDFVCLGYGLPDEDSTNPNIVEPTDDPENLISTPISHSTHPSFIVSSAGSSGTFSQVPQEHGITSASGMPSAAPTSRPPVYLGGDCASVHLNHGALVDTASRSLMFHKSTVCSPPTSCRKFSIISAQKTPIDQVSSFVPHPQNFNPIPNNVGRIVYSILSYYERVLDMSYIRPSYDLFLRFRESMKWQLERSEVYRMLSLIGCRIVESFVVGTSEQKLVYYNRCIAKLEQHLRSRSNKSVTEAEPYARNTGILETSLLKLMLVGGINMRRFLQDTASTFVELASVDSPLWINSNYTSISLAHALASSQHQVTRFVMLDSVYSMAYALPLVVEYDTSTPSLPSDLNSMEWIHGCPPEFQFALVEINQRCNSPGRLGPEIDWRSIENRIKSWQPEAATIPDKQSWKSVARLAIQESWRHTLLIYLYMAAAGVASDDTRVQASVHQVFKLAVIVEQVEVQFTDAPFHVQHLVAGICTPYEHQRAKTKERLSSSLDLTGLWLLCGPELIPVLDHLWRGAAADGRAIRWSDYVYSRLTILPVVL